SSLLNHTTTPKLHTLSLHDALPIYRRTINIPSLKGLLRIAGKTQAGASAMKKKSDSLQTTTASQVSRRWFIEQCGVGLGAIALGHLLGGAAVAADDAATQANPLAPRKPPLAAKAKNVIFLFMAGAPSHLDLFDYKP